MSLYQQKLADLFEEAALRFAGLANHREQIEAYERLGSALAGEGVTNHVSVCSHRNGDVNIWLASYNDRAIVAELSHGQWSGEPTGTIADKPVYTVALPEEPGLSFQILLTHKLDKDYLQSVRDQHAAMNPERLAA